MERYDVPNSMNTTRPISEFPIVATNYRLTEHYLSGPMSRFDSWLNELQPGMFIEISLELAEEKGKSRTVDWMVAWNKRGAIESRAHGDVLAFSRLHVNGARQLHQIGMPFHWGFNPEKLWAPLPMISRPSAPILT